MRAGTKGEKDTANHIEFALRNGKDCAVIHDLRLEHKSRVAQIDHPLVSRMFDLIVIESKNVHTGLRVDSNGEWEVKPAGVGTAWLYRLIRTSATSKC